ncbi:MAG TPA: amino acid ABC transporter permease [Gammaproteobacteria bacterium]|jgi:general L-amino acid transport system permease protein|nr:MAG: amino acid ABC transporter permease [Candidatus Endolissoclinum sp. TMED55]RPF98879.1 MAG: amino acid ABC transporter permease [Proteobacteria bacterium TMED51]HAU42501.1 amino acid ABC transporter permease [Gammaproteobacteria bacterium]HBP85325.1 amino acid ABC transporter permease [Gammaproteobacteria bacterium]
MSETSTTPRYAPGTHPDLPPPRRTTGALGWVRMNLLSSPLNVALTLLSIWLLWTILPPSIHWLFTGAIWTAVDRKECWALMDTPRDGACWAFIRGSFELFVYGWYPEPERWRVNLTFILFVAAIVGALRENIPGKKYWLIFAAAYPFIAAWLLLGGFGLEPVGTNKLGGILLTLVVAVTGISFSLPLGIALALGRRSNLPALRAVCVIFIEFIRGVPLITLLFVASTMLTYFLPPGSTFDLLMRVLIMVTLFASAYIAEVVRGGLQGLSSGQYEAADALGLSYWKAHRLVILPQALKISIPGIVNTFIGSYKDSTLVLIIGMMDILGLGRARLNDPDWLGLAPELYIFIALFFFISCFAMSRYSLNLEKKLQTDYKS